MSRYTHHWVVCLDGEKSESNPPKKKQKTQKGGSMEKGPSKKRLTHIGGHSSVQRAFNFDRRGTEGGTAKLEKR